MGRGGEAFEYEDELTPCSPSHVDNDSDGMEEIQATKCPVTRCIAQRKRIKARAHFTMADSDKVRS
jgi:hypothetical protein